MTSNNFSLLFDTKQLWTEIGPELKHQKHDKEAERVKCIIIHLSKLYDAEPFYDLVTFKTQSMYQRVDLSQATLEEAVEYALKSTYHIASICEDNDLLDDAELLWSGLTGIERYLWPDKFKYEDAAI